MSLERKPILLFTPKYLPDGFGFLSFIVVLKRPGHVDYEAFKLADLKNRIPEASTKARDSITQLADISLAEHRKSLTKALKNMGAGQHPEVIIQKKIMRYLNECFLQNVTHWHELPWYHQITDEQTRKVIKTACQFQPNKVTLKFRVIDDEDTGLSLEPYAVITDTPYLLKDFQRTKFLLEHKHQYFILSPNDSMTLDWLEEQKIAQMAFKPKEFLLNIVWKLEDKGYELDRNGCFKPRDIKCIPEAMVLVNEISNTFLQFIPTWNYEGIRVEGPWVAQLEVQRQGELYMVHRDKTAENLFIEGIRKKHASFESQFNGNFFIHFDQAKKNNWFFNLYQEWIDRGVQILGLDLLDHFRYSSHKADTEMHWITSEAGWTKIEFKVKFGAESIKNKELQKVVMAGQKSILLHDNTIGVLTDEWLSRYAIVIKHARIDDAVLTVSNWLMQSIDLTFEEELKEKVIPIEWQNKWLQWQQQESDLYSIPDTISADLRPYQKKGFEWMCLLSEIESGACLSDDMGLGKTLQTICFLAWLYQQDAKRKFIICCPASLIYNWKAEIEKFAPHLNAKIFKGGASELDSFFTSGDQVLITGYGLVRTQIELLELHAWSAIVVDESHNIKNPDALITKAILRLRGNHRIALSGTPVMNNTFDLYAQLEFLVPGLLGSQEFFRREYANPIDKDGSQEKIQVLSKITAPFIMRRTKKQVAADLPDKTESIMWCEMEDPQRALYEEVKDSIRDNIFLNIKSEGLGKSKMGILAGILRLRQICCSPHLIQELNDRVEQGSIKLTMLLDELENQLTENKVLVFSQFKGMLHLIAKHLRKTGIEYYHFDGDTEISRRQEMVNAFNAEDDTARVFLISLKAGNTGLNLTAADYVFLIDPWWNTAVEQQAIDRTHRIGQTKHVFAYRMVCKNTIEERIVQLQKKKQWISDELIQAEEGFVKNLSEEDVEFLFS